MTAPGLLMIQAGAYSGTQLGQPRLTARRIWSGGPNQARSAGERARRPNPSTQCHACTAPDTLQTHLVDQPTQQPQAPPVRTQRLGVASRQPGRWRQRTGSHSWPPRRRRGRPLRRPRWAPRGGSLEPRVEGRQGGPGKGGSSAASPAPPWQRLSGCGSHAYPRPTLANASKPRAGQARRARAADRFSDHTRSSENRTSSCLRRYAE